MEQPLATHIAIPFHVSVRQYHKGTPNTQELCHRFCSQPHSQAIMDVPFLRTPDSQFQNVPDFPYQPHYVNNVKLRMVYIDERFNNSKDDIPKETYLCLHGQPTWSYLYRKMIPILLTHTTKNEPISRRVVA